MAKEHQGFKYACENTCHLQLTFQQPGHKALHHTKGYYNALWHNKGCHNAPYTRGYHNALHHTKGCHNALGHTKGCYSARWHTRGCCNALQHTRGCHNALGVGGQEKGHSIYARIQTVVMNVMRYNTYIVIVQIRP